MSTSYINMGEPEAETMQKPSTVPWRLVLIGVAVLTVVLIILIPVIMAVSHGGSDGSPSGSVTSSSSTGGGGGMGSSTTGLPPVTPSSGPPVLPSSTAAPPSMSSSSMSPISASSSSSGVAAAHPACTDLYGWACADWFNKTSLPANRTSFSRFSEIDVINRAVLDDILREGDSGFPLLDRFFASCLDTERINRLGMQPLEPYLTRLMGVKGWGDFMHVLGELRTAFGVSVIAAPSVSNSQTWVSLSVTQAPLLLNQRAQYQDLNAIIRLRANISRLFVAAGDRPEEAEQRAMEIVDLERFLNGIMPNTTNNNGRLQLSALYSYTNVHLDRYFTGAGIPLNPLNPVVTFPAAAFFDRLNATVMATEGPSQPWLQYTRYKLISAAAPYLAQGVFSAFNFDHFPVESKESPVYSTAVKSRVAETEEPRLSADDARFVTCRTLTNNAQVASDLLGHAFMARTFNSTAYAIVESMVKDVRSAWTTWLPDIAWLDAPGRVAFQQKMDNMKAYIGGPPLLEAYRDMVFRSDDYFGNVIALRRAHQADTWSTLLKPFDAIRMWNGSPASTVNAYYYSQYNSFYLYAGFFQAPLFYYNDYVANAPWTGEVIGHEAGHGYDASGINFNQTGYRTQWLTPSVVQDFNVRTQCTKDSYSKLSWNGTFINGNTTITENMADIIGIRVAYLAYKAWAAKQPTPFAPPTAFVPAVATADQYFMAHWAQTECTIQTPAALAQQIRTDVHAPGFARINGAARLFTPMADAFNCPVGTFLNPAPADGCFIY